MVPAIDAKPYWEHLTFNTARGPLTDRRVRLALCYGFDVPEIFAKVSHGLGALGPTLINPVTPWLDRKINFYPYDWAIAATYSTWRAGSGSRRTTHARR